MGNLQHKKLLGSIYRRAFKDADSLAIEEVTARARLYVRMCVCVCVCCVWMRECVCVVMQFIFNEARNAEA